MLCWALTLLAPHVACAATDNFKWNEYGWSEIGVSAIPEFNATLSSSSQGSPFSEALSLKMNPGFAVHGGLGQRFLPWLSAEMEGGFYYNDVDEAHSASGTRSFNGSLMQVPILLNVIVHLPEKHPVVPFAGAGFGARINWLDLDDSVSLGDAGVVELEDSSTETSLAYQAFAGLRFNVRPDAAFFLVYRFNGAISPDWSLKEAGTDDTVATLKARDMCVHTLGLGFCLRW